MAIVEVKNLNFTYPDCVKSALKNINFRVEEGETVLVCGLSGCGKSTLLNSLAGFEKLNSGSIKINGNGVTEPSPKNITIFQNYGLLPWRNVQKNVELGLESANISK